MKNTIGNYVSVTLFGESHGSEIGAVLDGITPGIEVNEEFIAEKLAKRRPKGAISTSRVEPDNFRIVSGVFGGKTTGTPICILIENKNTKSKDYDELKNISRPGHADYTAQCKYHGFQDYRGGGHFSGRLTAPLVAVGAIAETALKKKNVEIATHILSVGNISDRCFENVAFDIETLKSAKTPVFSEDKWQEMEKYILEAANEGDSVGGILETAICGLPAGVGEPWFDSVEGLLSRAVYGIPAVKGVEFGKGFELSYMKGSNANDEFRVKEGQIITSTNNNGGINGGITNGMPVVFKTAVKPTPSIFKEQKTVDFTNMKNTTLSLKGRHDPAIVHRVASVIDAITSLTVLDILSGRFGTDYFANL